MNTEEIKKIQEQAVKCQEEINAILVKYNMALTIAQNIQLTPQPPKSNIIK